MRSEKSSLSTLRPGTAALLAYTMSLLVAIIYVSFKNEPISFLLFLSLLIVFANVLGILLGPILLFSYAYVVAGALLTNYESWNTHRWCWKGEDSDVGVFVIAFGLSGALATTYGFLCWYARAPFRPVVAAVLMVIVTGGYLTFSEHADAAFREKVCSRL